MNEKMIAQATKKMCTTNNQLVMGFMQIRRAFFNINQPTYNRKIDELKKLVINQKWATPDEVEESFIAYQKKCEKFLKKPPTNSTLSLKDKPKN